MAAYRSYKQWTGAEHIRLKRLWPEATWAVLEQEFPGRTRWSLQMRATQLGIVRKIGRPRQRQWSPEEEQQLYNLNKRVKSARMNLRRARARLDEVTKERHKLIRKLGMRVYRSKKEEEARALIKPYVGKEGRKEISPIDNPPPLSV